MSSPRKIDGKGRLPGPRFSAIPIGSGPVRGLAGRQFNMEEIGVSQTWFVEPPKYLQQFPESNANCQPDIINGNLTSNGTTGGISQKAIGEMDLKGLRWLGIETANER